MENFSYRYAVLDLLHLQDQVERLIKKYPKYKEIAEVLCGKDYFAEDFHISFPTMASISRDTDLPYSRVKKYIRDIHDLLFTDDAHNLIFNKVKYRFCFAFDEDHFEFTLNSLPVIPRVGENIYIPFFKANLNMDFFYVEEVDYVFEKGFQIVEIWCKSGFGNQYLKLRKDKAQALGEISSDEIWKFNNSAIQRKLRSRELDL
ncbi:hypothetical protein C7S20_16815 [Christiangramia fulva]|uniref:Uncharacterized protein n=2 Tax=Christiangramia fulva TaxID=2126553 RepID=A0A2R3Z950_9FLAO|nr:hypothetical protein C7S20_16815 [Christiangramia fulva]